MDSFLLNRGSRVLEERKRLGLTQAQVADMCHISRKQWIRYEKDDQQIDGESLRAFATVGADAGYILGGVRTDSSILSLKANMLKHSKGDPNLVSLALTATDEMTAKRARIQPKLDELISLCSGLGIGDMDVLLDIGAHLYKLHMPNPPTSRVAEMMNLLFMPESEYLVVKKLLR